MTVTVIRAFDDFVDDLSNWYIRRSRRRFWQGDEDALRTLWRALVQAIRVISPVIPFLAEHLWQNLVVRACEEAPDSVFLADWPELTDADTELLEEVGEVRRVVELGRQARAEVGIKLRQPLRHAFVRGAPGAARYTAEIADELRVKEIGFDEGPEARVTLRPNLPVLGPRLGDKVNEIRAALQAGEYEDLPGGGVRVAGEDLGPGDLVIGQQVAMEGWAIAGDDSISVALDTSLDEDLLLEGRTLDLIRSLNEMRKTAGLELTDRIHVTLPASQSDLLRHVDWIKEEVLAVSIETDGAAAQPRITKA
jgi:isoleucyl-tRNA synthetase